MSNQQDVVKELNQQVANYSSLHKAADNFHWYVKDLTSSHYTLNLKNYIMKQANM